MSDLESGGGGTNGQLILQSDDGQIAARLVTEPAQADPVRNRRLPQGGRLHEQPAGGLVIADEIHPGSDRLELGHSGRGGVVEVKGTSGQTVITLSPDGNPTVAIGGSNQSGSLEVHSASGDAVFAVTSGADGATVSVGHNGSAGILDLYNSSGRRTASLSGLTGQLFLYDGADVATVILDATTGDILLSNADIAEEFEVAEGVTPGCVVRIAPTGALECTTVPYDTGVAGVVSGLGTYRPGIVLDRQPGSTRRLPVAMVGKVVCLVDATAIPVRRGALLTSSARPGYAMAVTDAHRAFGAVIGKALGDLPSGCGSIPMLVGLR